MSSNRAPPSVRLDRAPLRDVQNERSEQQNHHSSPAAKTDPPPNRSGAQATKENLPASSITTSDHKSFTCIGGELDISNTSVTSDHSLLIKELVSSKVPQALNFTTELEEEPDHPYCSRTSVQPQPADLTFGSFTCPGGEVQISESIVAEGPEPEMKDLELENPSNSLGEDPEEHAELPSRHFDHLYCRESSDPTKISDDAGDVTFKSFTCPGGEVQISDLSLGPDESIIAEGPRQSIEDQTSDHPYSCQPAEEPKKALNITFKSFTCPGGEVQITDELHEQEESVIAEGPGLENSPTSLGEDLEEHTELPSRHFDHLYCHDPTKIDVSSVSGAPTSTSAGDVTFKSFTCPGGEVQITDGTLVQDQSGSIIDQGPEPEIKDPDLDNLSRTLDDEIPEEHAELLDAHHDHPYFHPETLSASEGHECPGEGPGTSTSGLPNAGELQDDVECSGSSNSSSNLMDPCAVSSMEQQDFPNLPAPRSSTEIVSCSDNVSTGGDLPNLVNPEASVTMEGQENVQNSAGLNTTTPTKGQQIILSSALVQKLEGSATVEQNDSTVYGHVTDLSRSTVTESREDLSPGGCVQNLENPKASSGTECPEDFALNAEPNACLIILAGSPACAELEVPKGVMFCSPGDEADIETYRTSENVCGGTGGGIDQRLYSNVEKKDESERSEESSAHLSSSSGSSGDLGPPEGPEMNTQVYAGALKNTESSSDGTELHIGTAESQIAKTDENAAPGGDVNPQKIPDQEEALLSGAQSSCYHDKAEATSQNLQSGLEAENMQNVSEVHSAAELMRSEAVDLQTQMKIWSEIILSEPSTPQCSASGHVWLPESPIPPPQLNSTELGVALTPKPERRVTMDFSNVGKGPLQDQLRKMAELLIAASGKIAAPPAVVPALQHNACVGTSPAAQRERSTNTSVVMEEKVEVQVSDACTSTDSLLWSVSRSSVESLSRPELEQKLISTLIMVEVLSQQLTPAQNQNLRARTAPNPSDIRDRHVQTERTELSQIEPYKDLYLTALQQIQTLQQDEETLHGLHQNMQLTQGTMMNVKADTDEALSSMKNIKHVVDDDQKILSQQMVQMKALYQRCMDTLKKMEQKNRACVKDRDDMKMKMEEALEQKATVLRVLEQLRSHHTEQISDLQRSLGSHQELTASLTHTYPQLVGLNKMYLESLAGANTLLREKLEDHTGLSEELYEARRLLRRTNPVVQNLQRRASAALQQSQRHQEEKDHALEEKEQMEKQLDEAHSSLEEAGQQIADLNTQITILSSEMAVLRERLGEAEGERAQLQRQTTELSATVSSTLASYAFLEQALTSETTKLQRSLHQIQEATERAESLQEALQASERRVEELEQVLALKENLLSKVSAEAETQRLQLRRLTQIQGELLNTREMTEFLQAENELTREQLAESEGLLRSHLQGLRERNLECEDLRVELNQLRTERDSLQQELISTRDKARLMLLDQGEQLAQATLDTSLLLQRVGAVIKNCSPDQSSDPPRLPQSSFVTSVIQALTEEQPSDTPTDAVASVEEEDLIESIGGRSSAFTRIAPSEPQNTDGNQRTTLLELLASVGESVSELQSAVEQLEVHKDSEIHNLHKNIADLQEALEAESQQHRAEGAELRQQVERLRAQLEKEAQVLQQKTQDEKALRRLCSDLEEKLEAAQKHRAENNELRREGAELRRALQQSQVEVQALRAEINRSADQSTASTKVLDDRIRLLREVEKLKASLMEVEESRAKLLERAKRHQMVHAMNQTKLERELHMLDDMIEAVRKALSSVPDVVNSCPELQKLVEFLG
ncbi:sperm-associated antigen 5 isoform X2 [Trichomycterus rosablanca]|uniref:sperm-associated antigen 5 isoform X2 n=1 Tax=Trichomycterus rosablanca TaxID=2290929 RepID=UPI002F35CDC4